LNNASMAFPALFTAGVSSVDTTDGVLMLGADQALFPSMRGDCLSRDALEHLVRKHALIASASCPSFKAKHVSRPCLVLRPPILTHYAG
jgi:hypothetical protein